MSIELIIGRFQPFHNGHYHAIRRILDQNQKNNLIIAIGSSQLSNQMENPFSYDERKMMIEMSFQNPCRISICPVPDINDYDLWVQHVVDSVPKFDVVRTNNAITRKLFEDAGYHVEAMPNVQPMSATTIREKIAYGKDCSDMLPESSRKVLKEIKASDRIRKIYSKSRRAPVPTTDIIIELYDKDDNYKGIVLVERKNLPHGFALPGGFHEYGLSAEENAIKEAKEETGLDIEITKLLGVYSDPSRDPRGHMISTVFIAKAYGNPVGGDDAKEAKVHSGDNVPDGLVFDHSKIFEDYLRLKNGR